MCIYILAAIFPIIVTFLLLKYTRKNNSVSFLGSLITNFFKLLNKISSKENGKTIMVKAMKTTNKTYDFNSWKAPKGYKNEEISLKNCKAYLLSKEISNHKKVVYQLHGGGYVKNFIKMYNKIALRYSENYDNADVFSLDYRVAPENIFPKALEDAIEGYRWLISSGYKACNIVIAGDSAGGGLALALTLYLRDKSLEMPKALILSSPWSDLTLKGESYKTKAKEDVFFGSVKWKDNFEISLPVSYAKGMDAKNPYISPVYGSYENMPPMLVQTGSIEIFLSDSITVVEKALKSGVNAKFIEYELMYHTFYVITPFIKESRRAWREIKSFIESLN